MEPFVKEDVEMYNESWSGIVQQDAAALGEIARAVSVTPSDAHVHASSPLPGVLVGPDGGVRQCLSKLSLLYAQAGAVNEHFQRKCSQWAAGVGEHIAVSVKSPSRAVQKVWRTYKGNPQFLLDLVRTSVTCDTPSDVLATLQRIQADPAVIIVRAKNRLDPAYDSSQSGGFRNICLNLVVVDDTTCKACTESFVCELQLTLRAIHDRKTEGGHKRFVIFRDMRAE